MPNLMISTSSVQMILKIWISIFCELGHLIENVNKK